MLQQIVVEKDNQVAVTPKDDAIDDDFELKGIESETMRTIVLECLHQGGKVGAIVYICLTISHALVLENMTAKIAMTSLAAISCLLFLSLPLAIPRYWNSMSPWAHMLLNLACLLVILNAVLHLILVSDLKVPACLLVIVTE
jgi:hypothetical protein